MPASTRPIRKSSRLSSPAARSPYSHSQNRKDKPRTLADDTVASGASSNGDATGAAYSSDTIRQNASKPLDIWHEPPILNRPSFEDHGFERLGVLSTMATLGSRPTAKYKAKIRNDGERRLTLSNNLILSETEDHTEPFERTPPLPDMGKSAPSSEDSTAVRDSMVKAEKDDGDVERIKASKQSSRPSTNDVRIPTKAESKPLPSRVFPTSRTPTGRQRLEAVVEAAVHKSREVGNPGIGLAIKQIFVESLHNKRLSELLDAILAQKTTQEQTKEFQSYVKKARKALKARKIETAGREKQSIVGKGVEKLPKQAEASRANLAPTSEPAKPNLFLQRESSPSRSSRRLRPLNKNSPDMNGLANDPKAFELTNDMNERLIPRRSASTSSLSSLTSIGSTEERLNNATGVASAGSLNVEAAKGSGTKQPIATRKVMLSLGNVKANKFSTKHANPNYPHKKLSIEADGLKSDDRTLDERRQKFQETQKYTDYHVEESNIRRTSTKRKRGSSEDHKPTSLDLVNYSPLRLSPTKDKDLRNGPLQRTAVASPNLVAPNRSTFLKSKTPELSGPPAKKTKSAARIKMSPIKKRVGIIAGIAAQPQAGERRGSPTGSEGTDKSNNIDFCSACSGSGYLLCCDGCDRSFHFTCCDPPLSADADALEEPWYCQICEAKSSSPTKPSRGFFLRMLATLDKTNPSSFALPQSIREYFEGVRTGSEGEYEEVTLAQKSNKNRSGYDELPDLRKLKDAKGNPVLCSQCSGSSIDKRPIIACDYCPSQFHLDCLDPPLANPPSNGQNGKRNMWMCPRHIDHDLRVVDPKRGKTEAGSRFHRIRRPKNAEFVDISLYRGFKNSGCIEVDNDSSDNEFYEDESASGIIYRLPEKGIVLDFISKAKLSALTRPTRAESLSRNASSPVGNRCAEGSDFASRPFNEKRAALYLAQLAQKHPSLGLDTDRVQALVNVLITESSDQVAAAITAAESQATRQHPSHPSPPLSDQQSEQPITDAERTELLVLQELIRRKLDRAGGNS